MKQLSYVCESNITQFNGSRSQVRHTLRNTFHSQCSRSENMACYITQKPSVNDYINIRRIESERLRQVRGKWNWKSKMTTAWEAWRERERARVDWVLRLQREIIQDIDRTESPACDQLNARNADGGLCVYTCMCLWAHFLLMASTLTLIDHHRPSWFIFEYLPNTCVSFFPRTHIRECHWACTFVSSERGSEPGHSRTQERGPQPN